LISLIHISPLEEAPTIGETMARRERLDAIAAKSNASPHTSKQTTSLNAVRLTEKVRD